MKNLKLILRNIFRHKLRASLTILGIAIAVMSFGLLRTIIGAWNSNSEHAAPDRLVTRHAISFIFSLPLAPEFVAVTIGVPRLIRSAFKSFCCVSIGTSYLIKTQK